MNDEPIKRQFHTDECWKSAAIKVHQLGAYFCLADCQEKVTAALSRARAAEKEEDCKGRGDQDAQHQDGGGVSVNIISLGAGVQSSAMALMATAGEIAPMPDCAIFADTQDEPAEVYKWLDWLEPKLSFPVHRVTQGKLSETATRVRVSKNGRKYTKGSIPAHIIDSVGSAGLMMRQCTTDFKIAPIYRQIRKIVGKKGTAIQWVGISFDEVHRMKPARVSHVTNRWPLVEKRLTRQGCIEWMKAHGYPKPPRSACVYCPYHNDKEWHRLKTEAPDDFQKAVEFEKAYQAAHVGILRGVPWLHRSHKPIAEVDFEPNKAQQEFWGNECEGMCGV